MSRRELSNRRRGEVDLEANTPLLLSSASDTARLRSFDHSYNYFQTLKDAEGPEGLASRKNIERRCMQLGFYLASWGMYRGSATILNHNSRILAPVVQAIARAPANLWDVDAGRYSAESINLLMASARDIRNALPFQVTDTFVTKVLLGTLGCVPAFDGFFRRGFGVHSFGHTALQSINDFAIEHREPLEALQSPTLDFYTGEETEYRYPIAKVLDLAFFIAGGGSFAP